MPVAYVIGQFDIHDPEAYRDYRAQTPGTIEKFGGKFLVRAGRLETLEGDAPLLNAAGWLASEGSWRVVLDILLLGSQAPEKQVCRLQRICDQVVKFLISG